MTTNRRDFLNHGLFAVLATRVRTVHGGVIDPRPNLIAAPDGPAEWHVWREALIHWREQEQQRLEYDGSLYDRDDLRWVASCYSVCFLMLGDEMFWDAGRGEFTVEAFLDHGETEFGGYDGVVLWHAYPRIGFDDRNQFDFYRDMPGGLDGLRQLSGRFHRRGVKVFIDYNPWDTGTRREGKPDVEALCDVVKVIDADGIFLDTLKEGAAEFRDKLDGVREGVVLESELALPVERVKDHHMSWAQWFKDSHAPGVLRNKWFERRHMQHQIQRWNSDHSAEMHTAWMNGSGMMVWENVFGSYVGWSARDRSLLRTMLPIQRRFSHLFSGEGWTPLVQTTHRDVYASLWERGGVRLWTLLNRSGHETHGPLLKVPHHPRDEYYDLIRGCRAVARVASDNVFLHSRIPPRGIGAFVAGPEESLGPAISAFCDRQKQAYRGMSLDAARPQLAIQRREVKSAKGTIREGMIQLPAAELEQQIEFRARECGYYRYRQDLKINGKLAGIHKPMTIRRHVKLPRLAIDLTPVTNEQFAGFLGASGYQPTLPENFLKHWRNGKPPPDKLDHPVVYVDLDDARAYARWAGKRLPKDEEWQYAAQGSDGRPYPWGDRMEPGRCNGGETGGTTSVTAFPNGRSPFGCWDMCGNTWEWTESEHSDGRTRFVILRGGSFYRAEGSRWYADGGPQRCSFGAKFLLMWPGLDRCATIGFRCAIEL